MFSFENVNKNTVKEVFLAAKQNSLFHVLSFTLLTALSAQVIVPVEPVPFTLQTMFVVLSGAFLGAKNGFFSQSIYLILGIIGFPVFAGFSFGLTKIFGPTGGYLLSFPFAAYLVGYFVERNKSKFNVVFSIVLANILILFIGAAYLAVFFGGNFSKALFSGAVIFSVWDIIKMSAAISIYFAFTKK
ncbi:biotin transporter BioY [Melioribacteraceae bacterium 4301-Me]|uniref:biotin transporter BioY n=1 Tax=Pyranulibacter aquaticus TaxID=3163344 RepID=UPI003599E7F9